MLDCEVRWVACGRVVLLRNVHTRVAAGHVLAVLGPSGAGKTTLLRYIAGRLPRGFQAEPVRKRRVDVALMNAERPLLGCFTARELVAHECALRGVWCGTQLGDVGLESVADAAVAVLSSGQRRRLVLALTTCAQPRVLLADEPMSGLDVAAARCVTALLANDAWATVCTMHQPSAAMLKRADGILVLAEGRVAFHGSADALVAHVTRMSAWLPADGEPVERFLCGLNADFGDGGTAKELLSRVWLEPCAGYAMEPSPPRTPPRGGGNKAVGVLVRRELAHAWRTGTLHARLAILVAACALFAWVYSSARARVQTQVLSRVFLLMWITGLPCCMAVVVVFLEADALALAREEIAAGAYRTWDRVRATAVCDVLVAPALSLACAGIGLYGVSNFDAGAAGSVLALHALQMWVFETLARVVACACRGRAVAASLVMLTIWFLSFLFAGILLRDEDVPAPLGILRSIFPTRWVVRAMVHEEFSPRVTYAGTRPCESCRGGFACTGPDPFQCFGPSGPQIVASLGRTFKIFAHEATTQGDMLRLLVQGCTLILVHGGVASWMLP